MTQVSRSIVLLVMVFTIRAAFAGDTALGESCDLAVLGASDKKAFLLFDHELRTALSRQDAVVMALLVSFPLRVNHDDGSETSLNNEAALQTRFAEAFPPTVRSAVLNQKLEGISCKSSGIMYGRGELWITVLGKGKGQRYRVGTVNLPAVRGEKAILRTSKLEFVCDAENDRIVIDSNASGTVRYRAWNKPRSVADKPDVEVASGTRDIEGTDPCDHRIWKFRNGNTEFEVSELGLCGSGEEPEGARGELVVSLAGKLQRKRWCY